MHWIRAIYLPFLLFLPKETKSEGGISELVPRDGDIVWDLEVGYKKLIYIDVHSDLSCTDTQAQYIFVALFKRSENEPYRAIREKTVEDSPPEFIMVSGCRSPNTDGNYQAALKFFQVLPEDLGKYLLCACPNEPTYIENTCNTDTCSHVEVEAVWNTNGERCMNAHDATHTEHCPAELLGYDEIEQQHPDITANFTYLYRNLSVLDARMVRLSNGTSIILLHTCLKDIFCFATHFSP